MRFNPKTEKEIAEAGLLADGEYDFEVNVASETQSKAGNDMIEMDLHIFKPDGSYRTVRDWLVDTENAAYKIRHFAEAVGMLSDYEKGTLDANSIIGRAGRCKVKIVKDKSGQYPDKNGVADYVKSAVAQKAPAPRKQPVMARSDLDDEVPF